MADRPTRAGNLGFLLIILCLLAPVAWWAKGRFLESKEPPVEGPELRVSSPYTGQVGQELQLPLSPTTSATSYEAAGLPEGLRVDQGAGVIAGIPAKEGTFSATVTATGAKGRGRPAQIRFIIEGGSEAPQFTGVADSTGTVGTAFNCELRARPDRLEFTAEGLPPGLIIDAVKGVISGTPREAGVFPVTVTASTRKGQTATASVKITISAAGNGNTPPPPPPQDTPRITSDLKAAAGPDGMVRYQLTASGKDVTLDAAGLPDGLQFTRATGIISGTTVPGEHRVRVSAKSSAGMDSGDLVISVAAMTGTVQSGDAAAFVDKPVEQNEAEKEEFRRQVLARIEAADAVDYPPAQKQKARQEIAGVGSFYKIGTVYFPVNSSVAPAGDTESLRKALQSPEWRSKIRLAGAQFVVLGFADISGGAQRNRELSKARARAVGDMVSSLRLANPLSNFGIGQTDLIDPADKAKNRAAELWLAIPR